MICFKFLNYCLNVFIYFYFIFYLARYFCYCNHILYIRYSISRSVLNVCLFFFCDFVSICEHTFSMV